MARQGYAEFPPITDLILGGEMVHRHGASTPSYCVLRITSPETTPGKLDTVINDFHLHFDNEEWQFYDCAIDWGTLQRDGEYHTVHVLDRRWKWRYGSLNGEWNVVTDSGEITKPKGAQDIAKLILDAMGESNYDVSALPNDIYPETRWSCTTYAKALDRLADQVSCKVTIDYDNRATFQLIGFTDEFDDPNELLYQRMAFPTTARPRDVVAKSAPTIFQCWLTLEAVGQDTFGAIKPINNLSYRPASGWAVDNPYFFANTSYAYRDRAFQSVFRWYRVNGFLNSINLTIPGTQITLNSLDEIKLRQYLAEGWIAGTVERVRPRVKGYYYPYTDLGFNTTDYIPDHWEFEIEPEQRLVKFDRPVYWLDTSGNPYEATLAILAAFEVHRDDGPLREEFTRSVRHEPSGLGQHVHCVDNLHRRVVIDNYEGANAGAVNVPQDNQATVQSQLDRYSNLVEPRFAYRFAGTSHFEGLQKINLTGALKSVKWEFGSDRIARTSITRIGM